MQQVQRVRRIRPRNSLVSIAISTFVVNAKQHGLTIKEKRVKMLLLQYWEIGSRLMLFLNALNAESELRKLQVAITLNVQNAGTNGVGFVENLVAFGIICHTIFLVVQPCLVSYNLLIYLVSPSGRNALLVFAILNFLLLPLTMLLCITILFSAVAFIFTFKLSFQNQRLLFRDMNIFIKVLTILIYPVLVCILQPLTLVVSAVTAVIVIIPAYVYQFYKILKIIKFQCSKNNNRPLPPDESTAAAMISEHNN